MDVDLRFVIPVAALTAFGGIFWWHHHTMVREHWSPESVCGRRLNHNTDSWAAWLNVPAPANSENYTDNQHANEEAMQRYRENIAAAGEQDKGDFNGVVTVIATAARMGIASPKAVCIATALPAEHESLFAEYQNDLNARIKADKATCLGSVETDVLAFLIRRYPCQTAAAPAPAARTVQP